MDTKYRLMAKELISILDKRFSIGDRVSTSDGFTGKITAGEAGKWAVKFDAPSHILSKFKKKQREFYAPKDIDVLEGENHGYNEAIILVAAIMAMTLDVFPKKK